jgi:tRNA1Val (adenine37-N6)-methyltransferase
VPAAAVPGVWRLRIAQGTAGYRFSLDAFLLADFVSADSPQPLLDLGAGCGVIALLLARRFPQAFIVGLELQKTLVADARRNVADNRLQQRVALLRADARQSQNLFPPGAFGTVVCNPPYRVVGGGRINPNPSKAIARHELTLTLTQWVVACRHLLSPGGLLTLIYHPSRLVELCAQLQAAHLRPRRLRLVHSTLQTSASMVLLEAVKDGGEALTVLPPLVIYEAPGTYTPEMQAIFTGRCLGGNAGRERC